MLKLVSQIGFSVALLLADSILLYSKSLSINDLHNVDKEQQNSLLIYEELNRLLIPIVIDLFKNLNITIKSNIKNHCRYKNKKTITTIR